MINANADAMGIIFPNNYDKFVPELVSERLMASIPFASRYRMIDFLLSSLPARAMPTAAEMPWPKEPELMSTPGVPKMTAVS